MTGGSKRLSRIEFALHHVEFLVDRRQAALRLHENQAVHARRDVMGDARRRAVIHIEPGIQSLEREGVRLPGQRLGIHRPATRPRDRVQVDRMRQLAVIHIGQIELDGVAHADPEHRTGDLPTEGHVAIRSAVGQHTVDLHRFQIHLECHRIAIADWRRHLGRAANDGNRIAGRRSSRSHWRRSLRSLPCSRSLGHRIIRGARDHDLAFHPDLAVSGYGAVIGKRARLTGDEFHRFSLLGFG